MHRNNTNDFDITRRPVNWLRCVALVENASPVATGVVFPDGFIMLRWANGDNTLYANNDEAMSALASGNCFLKSIDIEV